MPKKKPTQFLPKNYYENLDKKFKRTYHNPGKNLHHLDIPFRCLICGPSSSGKSITLLNIIRAFSGTFNRIVICTKYKSEALYEMLSSQIKPHLLRFVEGYENIPKIDDLKTDLNLEGNEQLLFCFDDMNGEPKQNKIIEYFKLARKQFGGISCIYLSQSYFTTPKFIRVNCNIVIFKKLSSVKDLKLILKEYQLNIAVDDLMKLYTYSVDQVQNWFLIDIDNPNPELRYRKNFTPIKV